MIITCANCDTSYELNESLIKETGSKVRCKNCSHVFTVYPPQMLESIEPEPDLELEMVVDEPEPAPMEEPELSISMETDISEEDSDSLNFPDIEEMLESQEGEEPETVMITDEEPELDLDLGSDETTEALAGGVADDLDFLDLSDIEDMLVTSAEADPDSNKVSADEPELSLEFETQEAESADDFSMDETEGIDLSEIEEMLDVNADFDVEDLELAGEDLELDLEKGLDGVGETAEKIVVTDTDSLDLSDIEKMLDSEAAGGPGSVKITDEEPELSLEADSEEEVLSGISIDDSEESLEMELELPSDEETLEDLSLEIDDTDDLDLALESEEQSALITDEIPEIEEDELRLEMEGDLELELDADDELTLESDASDSSEMELDDIEADQTATSDEDAEFELDLEDLGEAEETAASTVYPSGKATSAAAAGAFALGDASDVRKAGEPARAYGKPQPKTEKKSRALTYVLLFLLIIVGGAYGALTYFKINITELPYIKSLYAKPGEVVALEYTLKYDFYENTKVGSLLVITGDVENRFDQDRSFIKVTGEVLSTSQKVIKSQTVFCGNIIDKADLESEDLTVINKHLQKQFGDKNANIGVKAGAKVPFMVVFSKLPENIREFRVKVAGSEPAVKK